MQPNSRAICGVLRMEVHIPAWIVLLCNFGVGIDALLIHEHQALLEAHGYIYFTKVDVSSALK